MALAVMDGDVAELDIVGNDVDGHIAGRIVAVHIIEEETYRVGHDIALEVDGVEIAKQYRLARHLALDIAREGFHIGLEKRDIGMVGVKLDIERVVGDIDAAVNKAATAVGLGDVAPDEDAARLVVKLGTDIKVAHQASL